MKDNLFLCRIDLQRRGEIGTFTVLQTGGGKRRRQPELLRTAVPDGTFFYVLRGTRRTGQRELLRLAARCAPVVLTEQPLPPQAPVRVFTPRTFPLRRAAAVLCALLPQTRLPPRKLSLGVLDPHGALAGRTRDLLPLSADVRIVTEHPGRFDEDVLRARRQFGAMVTAGENVALLRDCDAVICDAPDEALRDVPVVLSCVRAPDAFSPLPARLPDAYARLCPDGVPHDLFASALAERCGVPETAFFACEGVVIGAETLDCAQASALWRARIVARSKNFS